MNIKHLPPTYSWVMTVKQTCAVLGIGRSKLYYLTNPKSVYFDPSFPKPIRIGKGAVRYDRHAVMAWYSKQAGISPPSAVAPSMAIQGAPP